jgi:hypothetical protein
MHCINSVFLLVCLLLPKAGSRLKSLKKGFGNGRIYAMRKRWSVVVFAALALIMVVTIASHQSMYAASSQSGVTTIQAGSIRLTSGTTQNATTASSSNVLVSKEESQTCFNVTVTVSKTGTKTNTFSVYGQVQYFCQIPRNGGSISITNTILCPGVGSHIVSQETPLPSGIREGSQTWAYLAGFTGICEICTNHVPTAFPFFTVTTSTAAATFIPLAGSETAKPSSYTRPVDGFSKPVTTGFANSPAYQLPC